MNEPGAPWGRTLEAKAFEYLEPRVAVISEALRLRLMIDTAG